MLGVLHDTSLLSMELLTIEKLYHSFIQNFLHFCCRTKVVNNKSSFINKLIPTLCTFSFVSFSDWSLIKKFSFSCKRICVLVHIIMFLCTPPKAESFPVHFLSFALLYFHGSFNPIRLFFHFLLAYKLQLRSVLTLTGLCFFCSYIFYCNCIPEICNATSFQDDDVSNEFSKHPDE